MAGAGLGRRHRGGVRTARRVALPQGRVTRGGWISRPWKKILGAVSIRGCAVRPRSERVERRPPWQGAGRWRSTC
ncbi:hypothetical protein SCOCK_100073 [Actinacidiphila cocklensis]|uniref:Uncharacterized protein n=1 Tax=Actinacidiphila cocklensis TaxID=887465 RepID=A0A9W4DJ13_9ACTN|nr:hypothetical protein SCOCK_100073 [Actinacidiphila cocklensis]